MGVEIKSLLPWHQGATQNMLIPHMLGAGDAEKQNPIAAFGEFPVS